MAGAYSSRARWPSCASAPDRTSSRWRTCSSTSPRGRPMQLPEAVRPAPGSLLWLILHEVRLTFRAGRRAGFAKWIRIVILAGALLLGVRLAFALRDVPLVPRPSYLVLGNAGLLGVLTFMTTQGLTTALRTLFDKSDLDLLLSSPIGQGRVLAAKLLGIAASVTLVYFLLAATLAMPVALL